MLVIENKFFIDLPIQNENRHTMTEVTWLLTCGYIGHQFRYIDSTIQQVCSSVNSQEIHIWRSFRNFCSSLNEYLVNIKSKIIINKTYNGLPAFSEHPQTHQLFRSTRISKFSKTLVSCIPSNKWMELTRRLKSSR